jgi:hypothetical protein
VDDPALPAAFDAFVARHAEVLRQHLARRGTQTNEVGRGAVLRPALAEIAQLSGRPRLALFDFGASAGLNLNLAHYRAVYQFDDGRDALAVGPAEEATPTLPCRVHGPLPAPCWPPTPGRWPPRWAATCSRWTCATRWPGAGCRPACGRATPSGPSACAAPWRWPRPMRPPCAPTPTA